MGRKLANTSQNESVSVGTQSSHCFFTTVANGVLEDRWEAWQRAGGFVTATVLRPTHEPRLFVVGTDCMYQRASAGRAAN